MTGRLVDYTLEDKIAVVTVDNPPINIMTEETREVLGAVMDDLNRNIEKIRAVIITGAGQKAFVPGADVRVYMTLNPESARLRLKRAKEIYCKIEHFVRPVICAINGYCLGSGFELAMCCDIRIAAAHAKLGLPEINLGIIPGSGATHRLARFVGEGIAKELIYTGRVIDAEEAKCLGLVNRVVSKDDLMVEARDMAQLLAGKAPLALRAAKATIREGIGTNPEEALDLEIERASALCGTEDQKEGAAAFLEKRKPVFRGR